MAEEQLVARKLGQYVALPPSFSLGHCEQNYVLTNSFTAIWCSATKPADAEAKRMGSN
jgi:hypothetical protein